MVCLVNRWWLKYSLDRFEVWGAIGVPHTETTHTKMQKRRRDQGKLHTLLSSMLDLEPGRVQEQEVK